jgi:hypothetical protein
MIKRSSSRMLWANQAHPPLGLKNMISSVVYLQSAMGKQASALDLRENRRRFFWRAQSLHQTLFNAPRTGAGWGRSPLAIRARPAYTGDCERWSHWRPDTSDTFKKIKPQDIMDNVFKLIGSELWPGLSA